MAERNEKPEEWWQESRRDYARAALNQEDLLEDPMEQFRGWLDVASSSEVMEPHAMTLATVNGAGIVSTRIVLLRQLDDSGFCFFTNYQSRKGGDLSEHPRAAVNFFWEPLERQVNVRGLVEKVSEAASDAYFHSRPYGSQIGAWTSEQSQPVPDRTWLEAREAEFRTTYPEESDVPRPDHWGGYRLVPEEIEFWQGRPSKATP
ncbi:MAG: pyridoxamine 5'-phosphate oxidase [Verrucomicrobiota bacterium]